MHPASRTVLVALCLAGSAGCNIKALELEVDHFLTPCVLKTLQLCPLVKAPDEPRPSVFRESIAGWTPGWGEYQTLSVLRTTGTDVSGTSILTYELVEVVDSRPAAPGTPFSYTWNNKDEDATHQGVTTSGASGTLLDGRSFVCEPEEVCAKLREFETSTGRVQLQLRYGDEVEGPLVAWGVSLLQ